MSDVSSPSETVRQRFPVRIAGADLRFRDYTLHDPVPSGRQLIELAESGDPTGFLVMQWLANGMLEELRLDETTELQQPGRERFIIQASDRSFRFTLEGRRQEWPLAFITGLTLKRLGNAQSEAVDVFLEREGQPDLEIEDDESVDLGGAGVERFNLRPAVRTVEIFVNGNPVQMPKGPHTGLQVKQAAVAQGVAIQVDFLLSLILPGGGEQSIGDHDIVRIRRGLRFTAIADDDNS